MILTHILIFDRWAWLRLLSIAPSILLLALRMECSEVHMFLTHLRMGLLVFSYPSCPSPRCCGSAIPCSQARQPGSEEEAVSPSAVSFSRFHVLHHLHPLVRRFYKNKFHPLQAHQARGGGGGQPHPHTGHAGYVPESGRKQFLLLGTVALRAVCGKAGFVQHRVPASIAPVLS